jgi:spore coat protein CotF
VRRHKGLEEHPKEIWEVMKSEGWGHRYHYQEQIHLDFYNEAAQTWFVLKYLNNNH